MRILYISDVYFPRVNGVSTSMQTFSRELRRMGHEVTIVAPDYGQDEQADDELIRIPARTVMFDPEDRMMSYHTIMALESVLRARNFDLIHIQTPFVAHYAGMALAQRLNLPRVETYHTFFEEYLYHYVPFLPKAWLRYAARRFSRSQCNAVDAVVVPSTAMRDVLSEYGISTPMEVLPTGIDLERFAGGNGDVFRMCYDIPQQRPVMLHVGRVAFEKNISFLLRVVSRVRETLPTVLFIIAGEGPAQASLQREVQELGLAGNVLFVDNMDRSTELLDCYRAADVKVFASRTETQGLVLLEAMALGVPVVSTAIMGTKDVLQEGCGAEVVPEDETAFATAVVRVLKDHGLAAYMSATGLNYVKSWSASHLARRMEGLYGHLIAEQRFRLDAGLRANTRQL